MWRLTHCCYYSSRLIPDSSLVSFPAGVGCVNVYRNVISSRIEGRIWDELNLVLEREGQKAFSELSTPQNKIVKHTYLEMHGWQRFTEVKSWRRKEVRRLPGLVWSETLMSSLRELAPVLLGVMPDTARVVEHNIPGYEMHTEHPTVGCCFLYLSLLSDTVLSFDDEASGRCGQVLLPQRSMMYCSGELRWGWRFGEQPKKTHTFVSPSGVHREVDADLRLSVQLWKFTPQLLDARMLQDRVEESIRHFEERTRSETSNIHETDFADRVGVKEQTSVLPQVDITAASSQESTGMGPLGGDYETGGGVLSVQNNNSKATMETIERDYGSYKKQFHNVHSVLKEMKALQDTGQPINDMWLKQKVVGGQQDVQHDAKDGFDAGDVEGTWDRVDAKARFYKARLRGMDYDGNTNLNRMMPDVTEDAPLDMKKTVQKIAPLVKDGEKILANFPGKL